LLGAVGAVVVVVVGATVVVVATVEIGEMALLLEGPDGQPAATKARTTSGATLARLPE
jgi:hypothetical protein